MSTSSFANPPWTAAEEQKLREAYPNGGITAAAKALPGRSTKALFNRVHRLGLKRRLRWTPESDTELRELWGILTVALIAKKTGRTEVSICWRAAKLGLARGCQQGLEYLYQASKRTGYQVEQLRKILKAAGVELERPMSRPYQGKSGKQFHTVDPLDVDDAIARWHKTETVTAAAASRGLCHETLRSWLVAARARGVKMEKPPPAAHKHWRIKSSVIDEVIAWRSARESVQAAAKRVGMSRTQLARWIADAGIQIGPARPRLVEKTVIDRLVAQRAAKVAA